MKKILSRALISFLPIGVIVELRTDDLAMRKRVDRELRKYRTKPTILEAEDNLWPM